MKICLITGSYPPVHCGVGDQVRLLAEKLSAAGDNVSVLTSTAVSMKSETNPEVFPLMPEWRIKNLGALAAGLKRISPDIIHLHYPSCGYDRGLAPNLLFFWSHLFYPQVKRVVTLHEYSTYTRLGRLRLWPVVRLAHRIICTNALDQEQVQADHPGLEGRIQVIPLGSNVGSYQDFVGQDLPQFKVPDPAKTWLVHFGTLMPNKGWETILPAMERLVREGFPVGLLAIGDLQPERFVYHQDIKNLIQKSGLAGRIHFTGYLPETEIAAIMLSLPMVILPFTDGARLNRSSLITALAYARAIVMTDPVRQLERVTHGKQFWGIIPRDPQALAEGIKRLWQDPALVARLQAGAKSAAEYFAWPRIVRLYRGLYRQLVPDKGRTQGSAPAK